MDVGFLGGHPQGHAESWLARVRHVLVSVGERGLHATEFPDQFLRVGKGFLQ